MADESIKHPFDINPDDFVFYRDEMQLISVEETKEGRMVTFQIAPDIKSCPFTQAKQRNGGPGTRFFASFIELDDQDEPINQRKRRIVEENSPPPPRIKSATTDAGIRCNSPQFHRFVKEQLEAMDVESKRQMVDRLKMPYDLVKPGLDAGFANERTAGEWCKFYIYWVCKIKSRRELSTNRAALNRYNQMIVVKFDRWANQ